MARRLQRGLRTILAGEYPTRYSAFENPGLLVENPAPKNSGGNEWAVYYNPIQNKVWPEIKDGVYAEIVSYQGKDFLLSGQATKPDRRRLKMSGSTGITKRFPTYLAAKDAALKWIPKGEAFARDAAPHRLRRAHATGVLE